MPILYFLAQATVNDGVCAGASSLAISAVDTLRRNECSAGTPSVEKRAYSKVVLGRFPT